MGKAFDIPKRLVWDAWVKVRGNGGAAGVDGQSLADFAQDEKNNLYKIWNRMSSGTYFPPPVKAVQIPKADGGVRVLGVPTVADRIAQTVVAMVLEPLVEPVFHDDSFGYRPGRSALDAVGRARTRCWERAWVVDLDIRGFFDTVPHDPIMRAVTHHTDLPWVGLYVQRWLTAGIQAADGSVRIPQRGTPQGSAISPLLSNMFMHYAFDAWLTRTVDDVQFERYCDDAIVHCSSQEQAQYVRGLIEERMAQFGLELHPVKTRIVYCYSEGRPRIAGVPAEFTFLGYTFAPRSVTGKRGLFTGFTAVVSAAAMLAMSAEIRSWKLHRCTGLTFTQLAAKINRIVAGWINYYGRFNRATLINFLANRINPRLVAWACRKYKALRRRPKLARERLAHIASAYPGTFAHWRAGALPSGSRRRAV